MRKFAIIALAGGILAWGGLSSAFAHENGEKGEKGQHEHGEWRRNPMDLTDEQKDKLADIRDQAELDTLPIEIKQRKLLRKLHEQLDDKASDADLQATLDGIKAARSELRDAREKAMDRAAQVFTVHQRAMMTLKMAEHGRMMLMMREHGMMMGGPGMMGDHGMMMGGPGMGPGGPMMRWHHGDRDEDEAAPPPPGDRGGDDDDDAGE